MEKHEKSPKGDEKGIGTGAGALTYFGLFAGPVAWALDLQASYALVYPAARWGKGVLHGATALAAALCVAGALASFVAHRRVPKGAREVEENESGVARARFLSAMGIALSLAFLVLVVGMAIPKFVLDPRD